MKTTRTTTFGLAALLALTVGAGCAPAADTDVAQGEDDYRSKPTGADQELAALQVVAPSGVAGTVTLAPDFGTADAKTGDVLGGLQPGPTTWRGKGSATGVTSSFVGLSMLASGQTTVATLAAVRPKWFTGTEVVGTSGGVSSTSVTQDAAVMPYDFHLTSASVAIDKTATGNEAVVAAPGRYVFTWGLGDGIIVDAKAGTVVDADVGSFAGRKLARVIPPVRELPTACPEHHVLLWIGRVGQESWFDVDAPRVIGQNDAVQRLSPVAQQNWGWRPGPIRIRFACTNFEMELPLGDEGAGPKDWQLGRVEVDDVEVTLLDGTKELRKGTFALRQGTTGPWILNQGLPTGSGLDLPPGQYTLVVSYTNNVGENAQYTETFTTP